MGVMLSAAGSFQWYKDTLGDLEAKQEEEGQGDAYEILTRNAVLLTRRISQYPTHGRSELPHLSPTPPLRQTSRLLDDLVW